MAATGSDDSPRIKSTASGTTGASGTNDTSGTTGTVATSQVLASDIGASILRRGGSAADAAIAIAAALTVCEPTTNGLGGDCFALVWEPRVRGEGEAGDEAGDEAGTLGATRRGRLHGLNASGRSPAALTPGVLATALAQQHVADRSGGGQRSRYPTRGWLPVTVPGQIDGWVQLHRRFGKLPFAECLASAISLARDGYEVAPQTAELWDRSASVFGADETWGAAWREVFAPARGAGSIAEGRAPRAGESIRLPALARTLESIAATNGESFYRGEIARAIAAHAAATSGLLTEDDLAGHASEWVAPIGAPYRGHRLWEIPPNGQGIAALVALGVLERIAPRDATGGAAMDPARLHRMIEAIKLGFLVAHTHVADAAEMARRGATPESLLAPAALDRLAARFDATRAQDFLAGTPKPGGTVQFCTADSTGLMVSFIQSNYAGFGSGVVIPGWGIAMQNRGACFTLKPGHPNEVGPRKRPYHTIIPGFLTRINADGTDSPATAMGVMGGFMQPQGHVQVVSHMLDHMMSPQAALDMPRWQWMESMTIRVEPQLPAPAVEGLRALGHHVDIAAKADVAFGRGQIIAVSEDRNSYTGGSDFRADGCVRTA